MKRKEITKNSAKKRWSFSFFKKHRALSVSLVMIAAVIGSFLVINYGRYVKDIIEVYYLRTKNFYFSSDKLTPSGKTYEIYPWSGSIPYQIDINMSSLLNSLKGTSDNIIYNVECTPDSYTICYFGSQSVTRLENRPLYSSTPADSFVVTVSLKTPGVYPASNIVSVTITASSVSPYEETLSATFNLKIGDYGVNYLIEDEPGRLYLDALVSNTLPTDTIRVQFEISDISKYSIDMSNNILNDPNTQIDKDANDNITKIRFDVGPKSSMMVRYYKNDPNADNSYTSGNNPAIIYTRLS